MADQHNIRQDIGTGSEEQTKGSPTSEISTTYYIDVLTTMPDSEEKELFRNIKIMTDPQGNILVSSVCQELKDQGIDVTGMGVSYYSLADKFYVFVGKDPITPEKDGISVQNLWGKRLTLKFRRMKCTTIAHTSTQTIIDCQNSTIDNNENKSPQISESINNTALKQDSEEASSHHPVAEEPLISIKTQAIKQEASETEMALDDPASEESKSSLQYSRERERTIRFVIEKTSTWKSLCNGVERKNGTIKKYSLVEASKKVGLSRKTLVGYLLLLRQGKTHNFDFVKHIDARIGILRSFVNINIQS
ncbi:unnamed protein product [Moneuplotes crassus]|uniref:Uncharacterized protein n=1 Tax=Euplotes crassus TaxID=5936 RepID=A0AAD1XG31_EUPCR|nr:unnamed protein product [Moneuplotes crassus]